MFPLAGALGRLVGIVRVVIAKAAIARLCANIQPVFIDWHCDVKLCSPSSEIYLAQAHHEVGLSPTLKIYGEL